MRSKVRREGTSALIMAGVNEEGCREILGVRIATSESGQIWMDCFRLLKRCGLRDADVVVADDHQGLVGALHQCFQGSSWQRCQTHFCRNVAERTPTSMHEGFNAIVKADTADDARRAFNDLAAEVEGGGRALEAPGLGLEDVTAVLRLPGKYRLRLRTTNMVERLIEEVRCREKVIRVFPNDDSARRLIGAFMVERHEEWSTRRKSLTRDDYYEADAREIEVSDVRPMADECRMSL